jgi:hypothetical protein
MVPTSVTGTDDLEPSVFNVVNWVRKHWFATITVHAAYRASHFILDT